ncbi:MAG: class I adenylate-forming enzyme family protein [Rhizomicrobium sp.]
MKQHAARIVLADSHVAYTAAQLDAQADRLARALAARYQPGERIIFFMRNRPEYVVLQLACERAGLVRVPVNRLYTGGEVARIVDAAKPVALFYDADTGARVSAPAVDGPWLCSIDSDEWSRFLGEAPDIELPEVAPDALCSLNFTSGTTGKPKGVMMSHANWAAVYTNMLVDRDIRGDDKFIHIGPLTHASGAYIAPNLIRGAQNILVGMRTPADLFDAIERHRATVFSCVPTVLTRIIADESRHGRDISSLRRVIYGAEPIPPNTLQGALEYFGPILVQNYGLTEAMMTVCFRSEPDHLHGGADCIGRPYSFVEVAMRDEHGRPVPDGAVGELTIRGGQVMLGYWQMPEATDAVLQDGWLKSGDLAVRDPDGRIRLVGRAKDLVISGGFNIYPSEVEAWFCSLPGITEAAVFGLPDPGWGEKLVAVVVCDASVAVSVDALRERARAELGYKSPKLIEMRPVLPRTANGKIDKSALKQDILANANR